MDVSFLFIRLLASTCATAALAVLVMWRTTILTACFSGIVNENFSAPAVDVVDEWLISLKHNTLQIRDSKLVGHPIAKVFLELLYQRVSVRHDSEARVVNHLSASPVSEFWKKRIQRGWLYRRSPVAVQNTNQRKTAAISAKTPKLT